MKSDLDALMMKRGFDAIVVMGQSEANHPLRYLTNGAAVSSAIVIKQHGRQPVLICGAMERDEAAKSGLQVITLSELGYEAMLNETRSRFETDLRMLAAILQRLAVRGTVSFYGVDDPGHAYVMLSRLSERLPDITLTGEPESTLFDEAYATKSAEEMAHLRDVADRTNRVFSATVDMIAAHHVHDGVLAKQDGEPLLIGDVRRFMRQQLMREGLEEEHPTIIAQGRDGGVPHSRGEDAEALVPGKALVFDLFPRSIETGYFHDMTRTFCLGFAPPDVEHAYAQVMQAYESALGELCLGVHTARIQEAVCEAFEAQGHPTPRTHPGTQNGYVHSVGHGLGLQIHAKPSFSLVSDDVLAPWQVFTIEPGLYYPEEGFGVRIEDTLYIDADGQVHSLTSYPKSLVIALDGGA